MCALINLSGARLHLHPVKVDTPRESSSVPRTCLLRHGQTWVRDAAAARLATAPPNEKARPRGDSLAAH